MVVQVSTEFSGFDSQYYDNSAMAQPVYHPLQPLQLQRDPHKHPGRYIPSTAQCADATVVLHVCIVDS